MALRDGGAGIVRMAAGKYPNRIPRARRKVKNGEEFSRRYISAATVVKYFIRISRDIM